MFSVCLGAGLWQGARLASASGALARPTGRAAVIFCARCRGSNRAWLKRGSDSVGCNPIPPATRVLRLGEAPCRKGRCRLLHLAWRESERWLLLRCLGAVEAPRIDRGPSLPGFWIWPMSCRQRYLVCEQALMQAFEAACLGLRRFKGIECASKVACNAPVQFALMRQ